MNRDNGRNRSFLFFLFFSWLLLLYSVVSFSRAFYYYLLSFFFLRQEPRVSLLAPHRAGRDSLTATFQSCLRETRVRRLIVCMYKRKKKKRKKKKNGDGDEYNRAVINVLHRWLVLISTFIYKEARGQIRNGPYYCVCMQMRALLLVIVSRFCLVVKRSAAVSCH